MTTATPAKLNVHDDYIVLAPADDYKGISAKQEFLNGRADVRGLPKDTNADLATERMRQLQWFVNAGYTVEPAEFLKPRSERSV